MNIAMTVRSRANCLGRRVGAVVVLDGRIVSTGYNGTPADMRNCTEGGCHRCAHPGDYPSGSGYDLCICVHAEQNALLAAARFGIAVQGGTLYTTLRPCFGCTKEMLQTGIHSVYYLHDWTPSDHVKSQYENLQSQLPGGVHHLNLNDPDADWALNRERTVQADRNDLSDETGHAMP